MLWFANPETVIQIILCPAWKISHCECRNALFRSKSINATHGTQTNPYDHTIMKSSVVICETSIHRENARFPPGAAGPWSLDNNL